MSTMKKGNLFWKDNLLPNSGTNPVHAKDVNSDSIKNELVTVKNELALVKTELATIKANQLSGDQKVQVSGNKPVAIQTVINAQSVAPGSTTLYNSGAFTADGARRLFLAISIDKQPWTAYIMGALSTSDTTAALYPRLSGVNKTFGVNYPLYTTLTVPLEPSDLSEGVITDIGAVQCAYDGVIRIVNNSQETATVTVRVIKTF